MKRNFSFGGNPQAASAPAVELRSGSIKQPGDKFGFINQDNGEEPMFVLPGSCKDIGGTLPPVGTRVLYSVVIDAKTGKPRAEDVALQDQDYTGTIMQDRGKFGFIQPDTGGEMFVMPIACQAFGSAIPPIGTRVAYKIVPDPKTKRPRAENVRPESQAGRNDYSSYGPPGGNSWGAQGGQGGYGGGNSWGGKGGHGGPSGSRWHPNTGVVSKHNQGRFGFIQPDTNGEEVFFMPRGCVGFGGQMPDLGTRVSYDIVVDTKTGRPRAENIIPAEAAGGGGGFGGSSSSKRPRPQASGGGQLAYGLTGTIAEPKPGAESSGKFGFIEQDHGGDNMFVMPGACVSFGDIALPPPGTRVIYDVVEDAKTGKPRAENVRPIDSEGGLAAMMPPRKKARTEPAHNGSGQHVPEASLASGTGVIASIRGNFGFIDQDIGGDQMFVLPGACVVFGNVIPPVGTKVKYDVVVDSKTGKVRAENVQLIEGGGMNVPAGEDTLTRALQDLTGGLEALSESFKVAEGEYTGTVMKSGTTFGFIEQDLGGEPMFLLPTSCGGSLPPVGTRVKYQIATDAKTGRPRAENVRPEGGGFVGSGKGSRAAPVAEDLFTGYVEKTSGTYGFIIPDKGSEKMFFLPGSCQALGGQPAPGTRVVYEVTIDQKTGRPRAENVRPESYLTAPRSGTVRKAGDKFGFVAQDNGEEAMFVMPAACVGFGGVIPPVGTRVSFSVVIDSKTGKPRAEEVIPEGYGGKGYGK